MMKQYWLVSMQGIQDGDPVLFSDEELARRYAGEFGIVESAWSTSQVMAIESNSWWRGLWIGMATGAGAMWLGLIVAMV